MVNDTSCHVLRTKRTYNPMVGFSKYQSDKELLSGVNYIIYNLIMTLYKEGLPFSKLKQYSYSQNYYYFFFFQLTSN